MGTRPALFFASAPWQALPGGLAVALLARQPVMALPLGRLDQATDRSGRLVWLPLLALAGVSLVVGWQARCWRADAGRGPGPSAPLAEVAQLQPQRSRPQAVRRSCSGLEGGALQLIQQGLRKAGSL